jgi:hypothetical protein
MTEINREAVYRSTVDVWLSRSGDGRQRAGAEIGREKLMRRAAFLSRRNDKEGQE